MQKKLIGKTFREVLDESNISYVRIRSNKAEEFVKANIIIKSIRVEDNNKINENISFPTFKFSELVEETWEDVIIHKYFEETKFLFVILKKVNDNYHFVDAKFWNMPIEDLENYVKDCWTNTIDIIKNGVEFKVSGERIFNNLPNSKENKVMHVRPHAKESAYKLNNGIERGDIKKYAYELPDGQWMTRQRFWLNNSYIAEQLEINKLQ